MASAPIVPPMSRTRLSLGAVSGPFSCPPTMATAGRPARCCWVESIRGPFGKVGRGGMARHPRGSGAGTGPGTSWLAGGGGETAVRDAQVGEGAEVRDVQVGGGQPVGDGAGGGVRGVGLVDQSVGGAGQGA